MGNSKKYVRIDSDAKCVMNVCQHIAINARKFSEQGASDEGAEYAVGMKIRCRECKKTYAVDVLVA